jgi:hypothetical protein
MLHASPLVAIRFLRARPVGRRGQAETLACDQRTGPVILEFFFKKRILHQQKQQPAAARIDAAPPAMTPDVALQYENIFANMPFNLFRARTLGLEWD